MDSTSLRSSNDDDINDNEDDNDDDASYGPHKESSKNQLLFVEDIMALDSLYKTPNMTTKPRRSYTP